MLVRMWRNWTPQALLVGVYNDATILKNSLAVPQMLNIELSHDPTIPLVGTYSREMKTYVHIKTCP